MQYYLIGKKLGHSFSPQIHRLLGDYEYSLKELSLEELPDFLRAKQFKGLNVTIPYKESVIPYLDGISSVAERIGAVNTIANENGRLIGYNTDYFGLSCLIDKLGVSVKGKRCAVLGSGGASKTAVTLLRDLQAKEVVVVSRDKGYTYSDLLLDDDVNLIINATPVGMFPNNGDCLVDFANKTKLEGVIDLVYNPDTTELMFRSKERGVKCVNGLTMLIAQAKQASELFTNSKIDDGVIDAIRKEIEFSTKNITLIGMPSCGKSTIGKYLAEKLNREFIDCDEEFRSEYGLSPAKCITDFGEEVFREKEKAVIKKVCSLSGKVIATGGGAILKEENRKMIKCNSTVIFIDRDLSLLSGKDRPLSSDENKIRKLYEERLDIYLAVCDKKIDGNLSVDEVGDSILRYLKEN